MTAINDEIAKRTEAYKDCLRVEGNAPDICKHNMYRLACTYCAKIAAEEFMVQRTLKRLYQEKKELLDRIGSAAERKAHPICTGVLDYFPDALLEVAHVSKVGNDQHNPGEALHWAKEKSKDEADALVRHLLDRGTRDTDGTRHSAKVAWRALAMLQREIDAEKATSGTR